MSKRNWDRLRIQDRINRNGSEWIEPLAFSEPSRKHGKPPKRGGSAVRPKAKSARKAAKIRKAARLRGAKKRSQAGPGPRGAGVAPSTPRPAQPGPQTNAVLRVGQTGHSALPGPPTNAVRASESGAPHQLMAGCECGKAPGFSQKHKKHCPLRKKAHLGLSRGARPAGSKSDASTPQPTIPADTAQITPVLQWVCPLCLAGVAPSAAPRSIAVEKLEKHFLHCTARRR